MSDMKFDLVIGSLPRENFAFNQNIKEGNDWFFSSFKSNQFYFLENKNWGWGIRNGIAFPEIISK